MTVTETELSRQIQKEHIDALLALAQSEEGKKYTKEDWITLAIGNLNGVKGLVIADQERIIKELRTLKHSCDWDECCMSDTMKKVLKIIKGEKA